MPDIEGVPYETTGTPLDQASAQALAARNREAISAGVAVGTEAKALARRTADALTLRLGQIETMAGLAPGEVTDAQTANLISQDSTATRGALNAALADEVSVRPALIQAAAQAVASQPEGALTYNSVMRSKGEWSGVAQYQGGDLVTRGGSYWYAAAGAGTTTMIRTNHVTNPRFANNRAGWSAGTGVTLTVAGSALDVAVTTEKTTATSILLPSTDTPAVEGQTWAGSIRIAVPAGAATGVPIRLGISYYPSPITPVFTTETVQPGETKTIKVEGSTVPTGKTGARLVVYAGGTIPAGATLTVDRPLLEQSATVGAYFDGSTVDTATVDYAWTGTVDASVSTSTATVSVVPDFGTPGVDSKWVSIGSTPDAEQVPEPIGTLTATVAEVPANTIPLWMDRTRTRTWAGGSLDLKESLDDGATWQTVHTFPGVVGAIREFGNGELMVAVAPYPSDGGPNTIWVSSGYPTLGAGATWEQKVTPTSPGITFTSAWSFFTHENIGLAAEYGPKVGTLYGGATVATGQNARYVYLTTDYGRTWRTIFDVNEHVTNQTGIHLHGVAWDKWWDRIWVTFGDDQDGTFYSDDLGETWHAANYNESNASQHQNVGILPMPDCILFGTDIAPNGVQRINRSEGKRTGTYPIDIAYRINTATVRNALCHGIYWVEGHPAYFAFGAETNPLASVIVATRDGRHFETIWQDENTSPPGQGLRSVIGPTIRGRLYARLNDTTNRATGWVQVSGPAPGY